MLPSRLRAWFVIHFIIDLLFGIPLLMAPVFLLTLLGWETVDPFMSRLVGAALLGIGMESYMGRNASIETYQAMLNLKIIWSGSAIIAILLSMFQGAPRFGWLVFGKFLLFNYVWVHYRLQLR